LGGGQKKKKTAKMSIEKIEKFVEFDIAVINKLSKSGK
jgi:hypothetical protein